MSLSPITMNFLAAQGVSMTGAAAPVASGSASVSDSASISSAAASLGSSASAGIGSYLNAGTSSLSNFMDSLGSSSQQSSGVDLSTVTNGDFNSFMKSAIAGMKTDSSAANSSEAMKSAVGVMTAYFKQFFPGMSDSEIQTLTNMYATQYADLAKAMDMTSLMQGVSAGSDASGASGVSATGTINASDVKGTAWGKKLAADAEANANGPGGWCLKWVSQSLARNGVSGIGGASAYMAADQLAKNSHFKEVKGVSDADLSNLPAGCVVVWDRGNGHEHGHICISLGDGREASDKIRNMTHNYGTSFRVFQPAQ